MWFGASCYFTRYLCCAVLLFACWTVRCCYLCSACFELLFLSTGTLLCPLARSSSLNWWQIHCCFFSQGVNVLSPDICEVKYTLLQVVSKAFQAVEWILSLSVYIGMEKRCWPLQSETRYIFFHCNNWQCAFWYNESATSKWMLPVITWFPWYNTWVENKNGTADNHSEVRGYFTIQVYLCCLLEAQAVCANRWPWYLSVVCSGSSETLWEFSKLAKAYNYKVESPAEYNPCLIYIWKPKCWRILKTVND